MTALNKQALREAAQKALPAMQRLLMMPNDELFDEALLNVDGDVGAANAFNLIAGPETMLALLDENLQLQRDKDSLEAAAIAMRDDMREAREKLEAAEKRLAELERSETQLIDERDNAESALNDAYKAVMGQAPEWSNWFSFADAIDEIELACGLWRNQTEDVLQFRARIAELEARTVCLPKLPVLGSNSDWYQGFATGSSGMRNECADAIRAAGIGVKGE